MYDRIEKKAKIEVDQRIAAAAARGDVVLPGTLAAWKEEAKRKAALEVQNDLQKGMLFDNAGNPLGEIEID
jgi:cytidylate kinase